MSDLINIISSLSESQRQQVLRYAKKISKSRMELIKEIIIEHPPTFYQIKKSKASKEKGEDVYDKHYLTSNLFFNNNLNYHITSKIIRECKGFLSQKVGYLIPLEKVNVEIEIITTKDIDLDGRAFFWRKLMHDIIKTPTENQLKKSTEKNREIVTLNAIYDDSTKHGFDLNLDHHNYGESKLIFRIYGRAKSEQKELDLFFK